MRGPDCGSTARHRIAHWGVWHDVWHAGWWLCTQLIFASQYRQLPSDREGTIAGRPLSAFARVPI